MRRDARSARSALAFELRPTLEAHEPAEARGLARDEVRLLVARRGDRSISHHTFSELPELLEPGDVVVINVSATIAGGAARDRSGRHRGPRPLLDPRPATRRRLARGRDPQRRRQHATAARSGRAAQLRGGAALDLIAPYASGQRLMLARFCCALLVDEYLERNGEPIRYGYVSEPWPLEAYQNVYATSPGSAEMPSAGRPFTRELISRLIAREIAVEPVALHTGVSSPESHEPPFPEWYEVPERTVERIAQARAPRRPRDRGRHDGRPRARVRRRPPTLQLRAARDGPASSSPRTAACRSSTVSSPAGTSPRRRT